MTATRESLESLLMERALGDAELAKATDVVPDRPILPDVTVVKVGGQSLMDRGREAVFPVVNELVEVKRAAPDADRHRRRHPGTARVFARRARHADRRALRHRLSGLRPERAHARLPDRQHARRARRRRGSVQRAGALPGRIRRRNFLGMPPYGMWQRVPGEGVIPPYRTDAAIPRRRDLPAPTA